MCVYVCQVSLLVEEEREREGALLARVGWKENDGSSASHLVLPPALADLLSKSESVRRVSNACEIDLPGKHGVLQVSDQASRPIIKHHHRKSLMWTHFVFLQVPC